ncbi:MAG: DJ-1/PfpI family protein [Woeseiaceae bacterium]
MRRMIRGLSIAITLLSVIGIAHAENSSKVFMYVTDGSRDLELMLTEEVGVMQRMLQEAGYTVDIATSDDRIMTAESATLTPTVNLADVNIDDYAGVILPCMAPAPGTAPPPAKVAEILEAAVARNKPIAASRGSVVDLAKAGGIADREYAFASPVDTSERTEFAGGFFRGIGVVRDGNISTAGICPLAARSLGEEDGTVELTQNFIDSLADSV